MSKPKFAAFSEKDVETIMKLRREGKSLKQIGKAIHRSDKAVSAYLKCHDVAPVAETTKKPCCKAAAKKPCKKAAAAKTSAKANGKKKNVPAKGVAGFDVVKVKITESQKKALCMATQILALADELSKVFANFFKRAL